MKQFAVVRMVLTVVFIEDAAIVGISSTLFVSVLSWWGHQENFANGTTPSGFRAFQRKYLAGYLTATMGDWLQGPYIFALYESYGFSTKVSSSFFLAGVSSSALLGTYLGILADQHGRRNFAMLYCLFYCVACLAKHVNNYYVLLFGDAMAGLAISLLYCVFDSWVVSEHQRRGFDEHLLKNTYSIAIFWNSVVAILAGEIGEAAADVHDLIPIWPSIFVAGYSAPFDIAIAFLGACMIVLCLTWPENSSSNSNEDSLPANENSVIAAISTVWYQPQLLACGIVCALFEGSMFIFVVSWTPALQEGGVADPPFGHVFAVFMIMIMLGSRIFALATQFATIEFVGLVTVMLAAISHLAVVFASSTHVRFLSFLLFESTVGMYFPMMGALKGKLVPEEQRSAIYGLYRVPLNVAILAALLFTDGVKQRFTLTSCLLLVVTATQMWFWFRFPPQHDPQSSFTFLPTSMIEPKEDEDEIAEDRSPASSSDKERDIQLATISAPMGQTIGVTSDFSQPDIMLDE